MKATLKRFFRTLRLSAQLLLARLAESNEELLDAGLNQLAGKDHNLKAKFAQESSILSTRNKGFNLTGTKSITPQLSKVGTLVNGGSGSGKSSIVCTPCVLTVEGSLIVNDPSGELFQKTSGYLESQGYSILRIDWSDASQSHCFNPLQRANTLSEYSKLASQLVGASSDKKDGFWNNMAIQLLVCVIRITKLLPKQHQTLMEVAHIVDLLQSKSGQQEVDRLVATVCDSDAGLFDKYASLMGNSESTLSGILASAATAVQMFALDENIAQVTSKDTLEDFGQ